jgi:hypothetical protein
VFGMTGTARKPGLSAGLLCLREQVLLETLSYAFACAQALLRMTTWREKRVPSGVRQQVLTLRRRSPGFAVFETWDSTEDRCQASGVWCQEKPRSDRSWWKLPFRPRAGAGRHGVLSSRFSVLRKGHPLGTCPHGKRADWWSRRIPTPREERVEMAEITAKSHGRAFNRCCRPEIENGSAT